MHMRATVRFSSAISRLFDIENLALLEAGPGQTLAQLSRQCPRKGAKTEIAVSIEEGVNEDHSAAAALGRLWLAGVPVDWAAVHSGVPRRHVSLPVYPFERQRCFADLPPGVPMPLVTAAADGEAPIEAASAAIAVQARNETTASPAEEKVASAAGAIAQVREMLRDISGLDMAAFPGTTGLLELGFDSLSLSQIARAVFRKFGVKVTLRQLLTDTLDSLAAHIESESQAATEPAIASAAAPIMNRDAPAGDEPAKTFAIDRIPLTESQREIWLLCQHNPVASSACNENFTLRLEGELDAAVLSEAVLEIVDRHDSLRCTFHRAGDLVSIAPTLALDVPLIDLSVVSDQEREERFAAIRAAQGALVFDLENGPLLSVQIVKLAAREHALIFNAHHIVCDGWSCDIILNELAAIYSARREGRPHQLPPAMQMRDYQRWDEQMRHTPEFAAETRFWSAKYETPPLCLLDLPGDRPHPVLRSYRGASEVVTLPPELPEALSRLGAKHGATLFTVLLAAYETLLFRLGGESDLSIGIPYAGQNDVPGARHLVGHCVNMLPMRSRVEGSGSFEELLAASQIEVMEALEHPRVTFGWLLQNISLARVPGRVPLIATTFNLYPPLSHLRFPGLAHRIEPNPCSAFQFDFSINCDPTAGNLRLICKYNTDLFDPSTVRRWLGHFQTLLAAVADNPARPLDQLPLLDEAGKGMLEKWNDTAREFDPGALLHRLFEAQVERTPERTAVVFGEERLTYAALNARANQLARRLQGTGVTRDVLVGICMERSLEMVVAIFAVLKAGGAYVPLDPSYPPERLAFMMDDARMPVTLTQERFAHLCRGTASTRAICLEIEDFQEEDSANLESDQALDSLAYVLYTSGSTGKPKGVMIPHRAICNHMQWMQSEFPLDERDRVLQKTSISFDASVWEFFAPLFAGAQLVMAEPGGHRDSRYLAETVARHGITILQLVPSMLRMLVEEPALKEGVHLRRMFCGGEALTPELCDRFFAQTRDCALINLYGPTECAIDATFHVCASGEKLVPIGRPVANTRLYILDRNGEPVPVGVPGELAIGGVQLARGYWSRPELTAAAFVPLNGERVYKTGDLARWLPDGEVEFIGRADGQVKVRGYRIELGEIERELRRVDGVADCAVAVREDHPGDKRLVAYIVRRQAVRQQNGTHGENGTVEHSVISQLKQSLPDYMIPSALVFLEALPRTPNGKLDRKALPAPDYSAPVNGNHAHVAPRTPLEERVAAIWREVLGVERVGIEDDFLALGGESLLALRIINRLREMLGINLSLGVIFQAPTVAGLSQLLESTDPESVRRWLGLEPASLEEEKKPSAAPSITRLSRERRRVPSEAS